MKFEFWLKNEKDKESLLLPVTPRQYDIVINRSIEVVNSVKLGDLNLFGNTKPIDISLEGVFSISNAYYVNKKTIKASNCMDYVNLIKKWIDKKAIIRLIIADEKTTKINKQFMVESIAFNEDNTTNGDINYKITLKEYRMMVASIVGTQTKKVARPQKKAVEKRAYTVISGDNLSKISRKLYGTETKWRDIYYANQSIIGSNPNLIYPGQQYIIP